MTERKQTAVNEEIKEENGTGTEETVNEAETAGEAAETAETVEEPSEEPAPEKEEKGSRKEKKLKKELEETEKKLAASEEKYLRMIAEYDNYRKRTQKEREGIYTDAYADALKEILPVADALEMALKYSASDNAKIVEGVDMTLKKFSEILGKMGVEAFGAEGETFDPNLHNAVMHVEDEAYGENVIAEVLMKGYRKGDKVLRYAMVKVAN
ncbi:MAG: nucleotide exchange factor GrpE [Lachnospiraceae bacterium]|nr:nucleotide exchange factor GrpE [Lachnospiraceae bacterium]